MMAPTDQPREMTLQDINVVKREFVEAARNAIETDFDLIEIHAANGYLFEQFLATGTHHRTDTYGGTVENRARFLLETIDAVIAAIGVDAISFCRPFISNPDLVERTLQGVPLIGPDSTLFYG